MTKRCRKEPLATDRPLHRFEAKESASESLSQRECGLSTHRTQPAPDNPQRDRLAALSLFDQSLINHFPGFTDSLKAQFVVIDLDQHEVVFPVITHLTEFAL
jgi:hypothetical protein